MTAAGAATAATATATGAVTANEHYVNSGD